MLGAFLGYISDFDSALNFINGSWLFFRLAPVCLLIENIITYIYLKYIKDGKAVGNPEKLMSQYVFYYLYTLGVIISFMVYLIKKYLRSIS